MFLYIFRAVILIVLGSFVLINLYGIYMQVIFHSSYPTIAGIGKYIPDEDYQTCGISRNDFLLTVDFNGYNKNDVVLCEKDSSGFTLDLITNNEGNVIYLASDSEKPTDKNMIRGKVIYNFHGIGEIFKFLESTVSIIIMVVIIVLVYELPRFIEGINSKKSIHAKKF